MKKFIKVLVTILVLAVLMYAEYRYIMCNIKPYRGERGTVYLEIFGVVDEYYAESINQQEELWQSALHI